MPLTDPLDRKLAFVPGARSTVSPNAPEGLLFPGDPGIGRGIVKTDLNNIAPRLGLAWDPDGRRPHVGTRRPAACSTAASPATSGTPRPTTSRSRSGSRFPTVFTLSDPYRNLPGGVGPFPFEYNPSSPRFTLPAQVFGPSLDFVWPKTYQGNVTVEKTAAEGLQRHGVVRDGARPQPAGQHRSELSGVRAGRDRGERQHAAPLSAGRRSARCACSSRSSPATITRCR